MPETTIRWGDGFITVEPAVPESLLKKLTYYRRSLERDARTYRMQSSGTYEPLYSLESYTDPQGLYHQKLTTMPGFMHRIKKLLAAEGWSYKIIDERTPMPTPDIVRGCRGLRDYQVPIVYTSVVSGGGIVSAATGAGKTRILCGIIGSYSHDDLKARGTPLTVVATPDKDITAKNYRDIQEILPDREIGLVMSGVKKIWSDDIQVITLDSLHLLDPDDVGILIVDEVHAAASDKRSESLIQMRRAARWGVSATPTGRFDGRDLVTEGIFGPVTSQYSFADGVRDGALVPITVYWVESPEPAMGLECYERFTMREAKYRHAVSRNKERNRLIGELISKIPGESQTLCIMQYLDQMNSLYPFCGPGVSIVHGQTDQNAISKWQNLHAISKAEREDLYRRMESAEIKKALSTYVYKQGVNFPHLQVVINAGGGGSEIIAKQIPGRESRKVGDKTRSFLVDFWHPWDKVTNDKQKRVPGPVHRDDQSREKIYKELGFEQVWVKNLNELPFLQPTSSSPGLPQNSASPGDQTTNP